MKRIVHGMHYKEALQILRQADGYYLTNTARDLSQSDFKNRILLHTDLLAAESRENANYFSLEITGGASVHVDILRKQVDPFLKLELLREKMPNTMFQTLCRGVNLFGYRPYPQNVIRFAVREFAKYVDVWRVFDFMNHVPNMQAVFEEVQLAEKILEPSICFSTGPEHSDEFYVGKVQEILAVTGEDIILCIKNHGGLGTPKRIGELVAAIKHKYPELVIHYHGHNTDGNDIGRITAAVLNGATIVDASDHAFTGYYGPPPLLSVIHTLKDYGKEAIDLNEDAVIESSEVLRNERDHYEYFESQFKGFSPTVQIHKLPGGAMGSSFEQAVKGRFLDKMPTILHDELPKVQIELGNWWSVTPGSQILWTTAVTNVLEKDRYGNPSGDLKNLLLGKYGPFPFYRPADWIYEKVFGTGWQNLLADEGGVEDIEDMDIDKERQVLADRLGHKPTEQQLVTYLQHPNDAVNFFKFEEEFGKVYVLPPSIFLRRGGYKLGESLMFKDHDGKEHVIEIGPKQKNEKSEWSIYLNVDHQERNYTFKEEAKEGAAAAGPQLSKKEIEDLAKAGDMRATYSCNVCEIVAKEDEEVAVGDKLAVVEAMKMQTPVVSQVAGTVVEIQAKVGDALKVGDKILKIITEVE
ncbi:MAG: pyruvate carboxylase [Desulfobulbaceae bacterium]|jgi:pyruvate carboxylase|nr:pyruvate carboxylase [Desulfobulbaceae bacterium]MDH3782247.1 pyruvate carboxylase [Desulfobulbaceae bacterium]MDH3866471.1 pyruvate carboxylase [Desulfobulbaceae bacterium]PLX52181.1 MAG: pyruvate carboxylase [Desulfobulbaceae bacterium]HKJ14080.1 biotin/lipoyl-containing protein [Desulfobulbales bacterium]